MNKPEKRIAVFPGSFDPITVGHVDLIERTLPLFDGICIAVGVNSQKKNLFTVEQRMKWLKELFGKNKKISVAQYKGLTVKFCKRIHAQYIIRGLRSAADFEYERSIAQMNQEISGGIETVFIMSAPSLSHVSSTIVRDIIIHGGDAGKFLPPNIKVG